MRIKSLLITAVLAIAILCSAGFVEATTATAWCHTFDTNLGYSNSGTTEVGYLHTALDKEGISYGSDGPNQYTKATMAAVMKFQAKYGIFQNGYVGLSTRAKLNALYGCKITTCTPNWQCTLWSTCINGQQTKTCADLNGCGVTTGKPATTQTCTVCAPDWQCTAWSTCVNGQQTKTCADLNGCGVTTGKPVTTQTCNTQPSIIITSPNGGEQWTQGSTQPNWQCTEWSACTNVLTDSIQRQLLTVQISLLQNQLAQTTDQQRLSLQAQILQLQLQLIQQQQARTCIDANNFGVTTGKPAEIQSCSAQPSITITSPNGGEQWTQGSTYNITWISNGVDNVTIELDKATPNKGHNLTYSVPASTNSFSFTLDPTTPVGSDYKIAIWDAKNTRIIDFSDNYFSIGAPATNLTSQINLASVLDAIKMITQGIFGLFGH